MNEINNLAELRARKRELRNDMNKHEERIATTWDEFFVQKEPNSRGEQVVKIATNVISIADGLFFGWKMYRRFGGALRFGKRK